jgi:hypothetical protein
MALRNHREILSHHGLHVVPFFLQLALDDRLGVHTEQLGGFFVICGGGMVMRGRPVCRIFHEWTSFDILSS